MKRIALATCAKLPTLNEDDLLLVPALRELGVTTVPAVWDSPDVNHNRACRVGFPRRVLGRVPERRCPLLLGLPPSAGGVPWVGGPARARGDPAVESTGSAPLEQSQGLPPRSGGARRPRRADTLARAGRAGRPSDAARGRGMAGCRGARRTNSS